ncbi:hypothetical protein B0H14DRAFT_2630843 [Mycena olivaceomarginata]|nr:hypothetical protein B0H14DRAFT_2630843 [Mycena olivaceomarginata]
MRFCCLLLSHLACLHTVVEKLKRVKDSKPTLYTLKGMASSSLIIYTRSPRPLPQYSLWHGHRQRPASYLSASQDTDDSTTLTAVAKFRTCTKSFDVLELMENASITTEKAALELNATHVVTSITYGGNVVATLTSKSSLKEKESKVSGGKLSLGIMEGFKAILKSAPAPVLIPWSGEKLTSSNLEVRLGPTSVWAGGRVTDRPTLQIQLGSAAHVVGEGVHCTDHDFFTTISDITTLASGHKPSHNNWDLHRKCPHISGSWSAMWQSPVLESDFMWYTSGRQLESPDNYIADLQLDVRPLHLSTGWIPGRRKYYYIIYNAR